MVKKNRYALILEQIFKSKYREGTKEITFERQEIEDIAGKLKMVLPKNLGDLVYSFRYRSALPELIQSKAGKGKTWIIRPAGRSKYRMALVPEMPIEPNQNMTATKVPDATPGVVVKYFLSDEQALLTKLRYNRLIDIFTGITCYSLQNHLRTTVPQMGQVETDEIYVGIDKKGVHYVVPVQAKTKKEKLNIVQIEQDLAVCASKFPSLICRPIGAKFIDQGVIVLFEFEANGQEVGISSERHYKLVPPEQLTEEDLLNYRQRLSD